jgi:hypothetical protein
VIGHLRQGHDNSKTKKLIIMFDYKYTVKSSDGYEWGLFKTKAQAGIMRDALITNWSSNGITFWVEEIK